MVVISLSDQELCLELERLVAQVQEEVRAEFGNMRYCKNPETLAGLCHIGAYRAYEAIANKYCGDIGAFIFGLTITAGEGRFNQSTHLIALAARRKGDEGSAFIVDPTLAQYADTKQFVFNERTEPYPLKVVNRYPVDPARIQI